jgi:hypothetical protein
MSDVSQGEGWWVASDGKWYPPHLHPQYRPAPPSEAPVVQGATSSDAADEPSRERSAIAVATAQQCVNGHDMPESQVFCPVCGSGHSEGAGEETGQDAPASKGLMAKANEADPQERVRTHLKAVFVVLGVVILVFGIGIVAATSGSTSSMPAPKASPSASVPAGWGPHDTSIPLTPGQGAIEDNLPLTGAFMTTGENVLVGLGDGVCSDLQAGDTTAQVNADAHQVVASGYHGLTEADLQTIITVATTYDCQQGSQGSTPSASAPTVTTAPVSVDPTPWVNALNTVGTEYTQLTQDAEAGPPGSYEADYVQLGTDLKALQSLGPVPGQPTSVNADLTLAIQEYGDAGVCLLADNDDSTCNQTENAVGDEVQNFLTAVDPSSQPGG